MYKNKISINNASRSPWPISVNRYRTNIAIYTKRLIETIASSLNEFKKIVFYY